MKALLDGKARSECNEVLSDVSQHEAIAQCPDEGADVVGDGPVLDAQDMAIGAGDEYATHAARVGGPGVVGGGARQEHVPGECEEELVLAEEVDAGTVVETDDLLQRTRLIAKPGERKLPKRASRFGFDDRRELHAPGRGTNILHLGRWRRRRCRWRCGGSGIRNGRADRSWRRSSSADVEIGRLRCRSIGERELGLAVEDDLVRGGELCGGAFAARKSQSDAAVASDFAGRHGLAGNVAELVQFVGVVRAAGAVGVAGGDVDWAVRSDLGREDAGERWGLGSARVEAVALAGEGSPNRNEQGRHQGGLRFGTRDVGESQSKNGVAGTAGRDGQTVDVASDGGVRGDGAAALIPQADSAEVEEISGLEVGAPERVQQLSLAHDEG